MMIRHVDPGTPLPFGRAALTPDVVVSEAGNFDAHDGVRVVVSGHSLVFMASLEGTEIQMGIPIHDILEAISQANKES